MIICCYLYFIYFNFLYISKHLNRQEMIKKKLRKIESKFENKEDEVLKIGGIEDNKEDAMNYWLV